MLDKCRVCECTEFIERIDLGEMAYTGIFPATRNEEVPSGHLRVVECTECGLTQLDRSFDMDLLYGPTYGYRSGLNKGMVNHLKTKVESLLKFHPLVAGDLVLDIGSSDGTLLSAYPDDVIQVGFDPQAGRYGKYYPLFAVRVPEFFSAGRFAEVSNGKKAEIITSIAMFYDLNDPVSFAREVADCLAPEGIWHLEQSHLAAMLGATAFDTICHEHIEYYGLNQIYNIARIAGLKIIAVRFNEINGGSFYVTLAHQNSQHTEAYNIKTAISIDSTRSAGIHWLKFARNVEKECQDLKSFLEQARNTGKLVLGLGASTKGNVILQYAGIGPDDISAISDVNEDKWGRFTPHPDPSQRIPIVSEAEARAMQPDYFLVLPWHFKTGIIEREQEFLNQGGALVFPLPEFSIHRADATTAKPA